MNRLRVIIAATLLTICTAFSREPGGVTPAVPQTNELETKFQEAEKILYRLVLPNTMARTEPRSKEDVQTTFDNFERIADAFKQHPTVSVPFLAAKVASTPPQDQDPAVCALQLLYEINSELSWQVIRTAQKHPYEVVSRLAKRMVTKNQDALWGFEIRKGRN